MALPTPQPGRCEPFDGQVATTLNGIQNTHHNAVTVTGNGTDALVATMEYATVYVTGSATARTVTFYGSTDGTNYVNIRATNLNTGTAARRCAVYPDEKNAGTYPLDYRGRSKSIINSNHIRYRVDVRVPVL